MGMLRDWLNRETDLQELLAEAGRVGEVNEIVRMGILAAQLGLTVDDVEKMATVYFMLRDTSMVADSDFVIERFLKAVRLASR